MAGISFSGSSSSTSSSFKTESFESRVERERVQLALQSLNKEIVTLKADLAPFGDYHSNIIHALNKGITLPFKDREITYPGLNIESETSLSSIQDIVTTRMTTVNEQLEALKKVLGANVELFHTTAPSGKDLEYMRFRSEIVSLGRILGVIQKALKLDEKIAATRALV